VSDFKGRYFEGEIVLWAVRWYCRYGASYRDLEQMMGERGVSVERASGEVAAAEPAIGIAISLSPLCTGDQAPAMMWSWLRHCWTNIAPAAGEGALLQSAGKGARPCSTVPTAPTPVARAGAIRPRRPAVSPDRVSRHSAGGPGDPGVLDATARPQLVDLILRHVVGSSYRLPAGNSERDKS
jgi:hypothetical protein